MIVQCEHCQTKYRIADEKVKGKGVKVRCAKCEHVFTVTPPENDLQATKTVPPAPPAPEPPVPEPTGQEPIGTEQPAPPAPSAPEPSDGIEPSHSTDVIEGPPGLPPLPPLDGAQAPPAQDEGHLPDETASPDQALDDSGAQRPAHELDQTGLVSPPPSTTELPVDGGFEMEGTKWEGSEPGEDPFGGESGEGVGTSLPEPGPDAEWGNIAIDGQAAPDPAGGDFGLADSAPIAPAPPPPMEEPVEHTPPDQRGDAASETSLVPAYQPESKTSGGGKKGLVILLLLAALGGGGYYAYPTVMEMIQSRGQQAEGTLTPANVQVKVLNRTDGKIIYSVRGEVRNESAGNVGMIQVEAQFRNASGDVLSKVTSFCGNLLEDSELISLDLNEIRADLQNELGQSLSNASIDPGRAVPFLIVLDNPPSGVSKVTVTILSFKETT